MGLLQQARASAGVASPQPATGGLLQQARQAVSAQASQPQPTQQAQPSQPTSKPTLIESAKNTVTSVFSTIYKAITTPPKPPEPKQTTIKIEPGQSRLTPEQFKQSGMIGIPASTPISSQEVLAPSTISQKTKGNAKAPEPTITDIAQNYMDKLFGVTPEERAKIKLGDQMALAQNAYAMKTQHLDVSAGYSLTDLLDKSQSPFTETPTQTVSKQVLDKIGINRQMNSKELTDVMMALSLPASFSLGAEGLAPSVLKQLVSLGKFTATSVAIDTALKAVTGKGSFRELLPEDTPGAIKDAVSIADFVGKAYISHGLQPGKLLDVFTKETLRKYNAPEKVYLSGDQIKNIFQDGKLTTAQQKQAFTELGLDGSAVKKLFAKEGITIEMPTENVTRVVDRPWWAKVKELLKVDPAETVKVEKTPAKIVGNEPGAKVTIPDQKPVALIGDGKPAVVKANVTTSEGIKPVDRSKLSPSSELYQEKAPVAKAEVKPKTEIAPIVPIKEQNPTLSRPLDKKDYETNLKAKIESLPDPKPGEVQVIQTGDSEWVDTQVDEAIGRGTNANTKVFTVKESDLKLTGNSEKDLRGERILKKTRQPLTPEQQKANIQEYRNIAQNLPPVEKMAGIKDVKTSLSNIKTQIDQLTTTAKGIATLAQEQRTGLNTKDIAKLKRIYAKSTKFQEGDLETIRNSNTGQLLNNVVEDIQTKYPDLNEQEAFDFALNLPNKANESIKNTPQLRTLREQKKSLDSYMELLRSKEKQLQDVASESTYNEWQSVMNAQEELAKVVEVPRYNLPVEGSGKLKASRLEARMKGVLKNASPELAEQLGLSTFNQVNRDENIALASEYVLNNPEEAMRVLSGEIPAPKGILNNAIFVAMERMSIGDVKLATKLASLVSTRGGQEIGILAELDPNSPVKAMSGVIKVREQAFAKKFAGRSVAEVKKDVVKKIKENIKPPTKDDWSSFIDSIEC